MSSMNFSRQRLLKAIGGIDDKYIEEALNYKVKANNKEKGQIEFAEPEKNVLSKTKGINAGKWAAMAAVICVSLFAVLIFARTNLFKPVTSNRLGDLLQQMDFIDSLNVTVVSLADMGIDTIELTQLDRNLIASYVYELEKNEVNDSSHYSEMPERPAYTVNIVYKNGETLEIDIQMNGFYFVDKNGKERADLYRDQTENYSRLTEYINKIVYNYKVNACESGGAWENIKPGENGVVDKDYLDGYIAELVVYDYRYTSDRNIKAAKNVNLLVTLPDGLECGSGKSEGMQRESEVNNIPVNDWLKYIVPECYTDAVKILKLRQDGNTEYVLMHWCEYENADLESGSDEEEFGDYEYSYKNYDLDGLYKVSFYSLDRSLYNSGCLVLVPYTAEINGETTDRFTLSRDVSFDGENIFTDITSKTALTLDIATHTAEIGEYDPDDPVFSEAVLADFDDYFALEPFRWDKDTPFSSDGLIHDNKYYYIYADSKLNEHRRCNWGVKYYDFETEETVTFSERSSYNLEEPILLGVCDEYLYYMNYWRDLIVSEEQRDRTKLIGRQQVGIASDLLIHTMLNNEYAEYMPEGSPPVQIGDYLYYIDRFDPDEPQRQFICRLDLKNGGGRDLFMDDASKPARYKDGIIYYKNGAVYYVENPNEITEYLGTSTEVYDKPLKVAGPDQYNDGGEWVLDVKAEKLFDLRLDDEGGDVLCSDGENIYFLDGYKKFAVRLGVRQDKEFCNFGVFKEENGEFELQTIANFNFRTSSLKCADGLVIIGDSMLYDPENNVLVNIPTDGEDTDSMHTAIDTIIIGDNIIAGTYRLDDSGEEGSINDTLETYRIVKK